MESCVCRCATDRKGNSQKAVSSDNEVALEAASTLEDYPTSQYPKDHGDKTLPPYLA